MSDYMKKPCKWCPFRRDVDFKFTPERAEEFAYQTQNPFNSFPCHETADVLEDEDGYEGGFVHGETSKECAGFLSMQINENGDDCCPDGFKVSPLAYSDADEMIDRYYDLDY